MKIKEIKKNKEEKEEDEEDKELLDGTAKESGGFVEEQIQKPDILKAEDIILQSGETQEQT